MFWFYKECAYMSMKERGVYFMLYFENGKWMKGALHSSELILYQQSKTANQ